MKSRVLVGIVSLLSAPCALGADWTFDPRAAVLGVYNDNARLTETPGGEIEVTGAKLDALLAMRASTPRTKLLVTPQIRSTFYPGDESEETDDWFLPVWMEYSSERFTASLNAQYSQVDTLGDYFPEASVREDDVLGEPDRGVGVGRTTTANREDRLTVAPGVSFELSPRRLIEFRAEYLDVAYDVQVPGDREDFDNVLALIGFRQALSSTSSVSFRTVYTTYDTAEGESSDAFGLTAEWRNNLSETAEVYFRGGASRLEVIDSDGSSKWDNGFVGGAGVRWAFEVTDIWIDAVHTLDPNSSGSIVTRDQLLAQLVRRLGPKTGVSVGVRFIADSASGDPEFIDGTYANGTVGFEWRFARQWSLSGYYEYAWREYDGSSSDAKANTINLGFVYEPHRR